MTQITAAILIIGNEILSGKTQEKNMHWLSGELKEIGVTLTECRIVRDEEDQIISAIDALRATNDYVFTSGGIGPTHDDITSATIAKAFGVKLYAHPDAVAVLEDYYEPDQRTAARMKMAQVPMGASLINNPVSAAPGFVMENVHVMAGVPRIFQAMVQQIKPNLKGGDKAISKILTAYVREGDIAGPLAELDAQYETVEIGSYPFFRSEKYGTQIVFTATDDERLEAAYKQCKKMLDENGDAYES